MEYVNENVKKLNFIPVIFFITIFIIGITIVRDYGIGWDEGIGIRNAVISICEVNRRSGYLFLSAQKQKNIIENSGYSDKIISLNEYYDKDYGVINELMITIPGILLKLYKEPKNLIYLRHFLIFVYFLISLIAFYKILQLKFNNYKISLIGCLLIILSPRIFADSFYNPKDLMFCSLFVLSIYSMLIFLKNNNYKWIFIHSLFSALAVDVRLSANIIILNTLFLILINFINENEKKKIFWDYLKKTIIYLILVSFFIILFWPYLWSNPINNFITALKNMTSFRYNFPELYFGDIVFPNNLPWHYLPVWISITVPILYLIYFLVGIIQILTDRMKNIIKDVKEGRKYKFLNTFSEQIDFVFVVSFFCPIILVILLNTSLYNGWRHLYFLYPSFAYISILGFNFIWDAINKIPQVIDKKRFYYTKFSFVTVNILFFSWIAFEMIINHPYQMVYFNEFVRSNAEKSFSLDYWGLSYKRGLDWVYQDAKDKEKIRLFFADEHTPIIGNLRLFSLKEREKFEIAEFNEAEYFVTAYAEVNFKSEDILKKYNIPKNQEVYSISSYGMKILSVYKLR